MFNVIVGKDKAKKQEVNKVKIPELEGRLKIELFNAETGELEKKVEGKNMVTDAIKDIFASNYFGLIDYESLFPIMDTFFAGILCFRDTLVENAKNYYPPDSSNPVVAHAGQTTYTSAEADTTRGLPNDVESGEVTNGYTRVWDFPATQGNGTISALAMTHSDTGSYWLFNGTSFNPYQVIKARSAAVTDVAPLFFDKTRRLAYVLTGSGTTLTIKVLGNYGVINDIGLLQRNLTASHSDAISVDTFTMPADYNLCRYMYMEADREIHCLYPSGNTIYRKIIDLSDMTMTTDNIVVTGASFVSFATGGNSNPNQNCCPISLDIDGRLYVRGSNKVYCIDYSNPVDVEETAITITTGDFLGVSNGIGHWNYFTGSSASDKGIISDDTHAYAVAHQNLFWNTAGLVNGQPIDNQLVLWTPYCARDFYSNMHLVMNKMFMSTIKNLESPVTKISTQTMKITYTITEAQAE